MYVDQRFAKQIKLFAKGSVDFLQIKLSDGIVFIGLYLVEIRLCTEH
jgi:hypothetical protein